MNQGARDSHKGKTSKTGITDLENPKTDTDNSWIHDGWSLDGMMTGVLLDGTGHFRKLPVVNGFLMVELGNSKDTTKTDCSDL